MLRRPPTALSLTKEDVEELRRTTQQLGTQDVRLTAKPPPHSRHDVNVPSREVPRIIDPDAIARSVRRDLQE